MQPCRALSLKMRMEKAGALVRPTMIAPACLRLATTGLSSLAMKSFSGTTPLSVGNPAWSTLTLVVTGTPCSGGRAWPRARAASAVSAAARASGSSTRTTALIVGLTACRRFRTESTASRAEAWPVRMRRARSVASYCQSSMKQVPSLSLGLVRAPLQWRVMLFRTAGLWPLMQAGAASKRRRATGVARSAKTHDAFFDSMPKKIMLPSRSATSKSRRP